MALTTKQRISLQAALLQIVWAISEANRGQLQQAELDTTKGLVNLLIRSLDD